MKSYKGSLRFRYDDKKNETTLYAYLGDELICRLKKPGMVSAKEAQTIRDMVAASMASKGYVTMIDPRQ